MNKKVENLLNRVVKHAQFVHDYVQIEFVDGTVLTLNNIATINGNILTNNEEGLKLLKGIESCEVTDVSVRDLEIALEFNKFLRLVISLAFEAWRSPEALILNFPNEPLIVVN